MPESKPIVGFRIRGLALALFVTLILAAMAVTRPVTLQSIEFKIYDLFLRFSPADKIPVLPAIVALDEKAIGKFGQWPWPRYRVAMLLEKIKRLGAITIGLDILFPEADRTSPKVLEEQLHRDLNVQARVTGLPDELKDNDGVLARILAHGPFVMGYALLFQEGASPEKDCALHPLKTVIVSPEGGWNPTEHLINAEGALCSLKILGKAADSAGFINTLVDEDGIIRRSPLLAVYHNRIYPSLALATLMHAEKSDQVLIKVNKDGGLSLRVGPRTIPLDDSGYFWIKYRAARDRFNRISAADILEDRVAPEQLEGKIVFVGTAAAGIGDTHATPMRVGFPGVLIQAAIADNILSEQYVRLLPWTSVVELMLIVSTGLLAWLLLLPGRPLWGFLGLIFLGAGIWWGSLWLFSSRSLFFSPFMPLLNLFAVFILLALLNLRRAISRARTLKLEKFKADEVSRFKSDFLANMSHEIRTPMNAIIGLSHLALQTKLSAKQADYLNKIQRASKSLLGIINDILDFSKIEAGKLDMEEVNFRLEDVLDNLSSIISLKAREKGLEFLFDTDPEAPGNLVGDPLRLGQVLINLVNNAIKFTDHGEVVVALRLLQKSETQAMLQFSVRDTGIGLSRDEVERLFKPFTQADRGTTRKYGGTGLGLSISRNLVDMMGGKIWVESAPGKGSTFFFTARFGLHAEDSPAKAIDTDLQGKGAESGLQKALAKIRGARILLAEDNEINQQVARELLEQQGLSVHVVANGREAVSAVAKSPFDLVLTDIHMPVMDGYEATAQIRNMAAFKDLPIVAVSAQALAGDREKSLAAGMNDHVSKPIDPEKLFRVLVKWIPPLEHRIPSPQPSQKTFRPLDPAPENLPEINLSEGLARVAGNRALYAKLLQDFARQYGSEYATLNELLHENNLEEMGSLIHSIKGTAANLGANDLNGAAQALEKALKSDHLPLIEDALHGFEQHLKALLAAITRTAPKTPPREESPDATPGGAKTPNLKETASLMGEMKALLESSSLDADQVLARLKSQLEGTPFQEPLQTLEEKLNDFDYAQALIELAHLKERLGLKDPA